MKKTYILLSLLAVSFVQAMACTNFIVGKKASADGSVMCTYNADSYGAFFSLYHSPAGKHPKGEMLKIYILAPLHGSSLDGGALRKMV